MEKNQMKYLCIEFKDQNGNLIPYLSKCPASPEMVMSALQFLSDGCEFTISIKDEPVNFFKTSCDEVSL